MNSPETLTQHPFPEVKDNSKPFYYESSYLSEIFRFVWIDNFGEPLTF
jgi:hypothetical protein